MTAVIIVVLFSLGMFEAVGIQFGMDQMVEASSDQISAFTHWYYWSMNSLVKTTIVWLPEIPIANVHTLVNQCSNPQ